MRCCSDLLLVEIASLLDLLIVLVLAFTLANVLFVVIKRLRLLLSLSLLTCVPLACVST